MVLPPFFLGATIIGVALVSLFFFCGGVLVVLPPFFLGATIIGVALVSFVFFCGGVCVTPAVLSWCHNNRCGLSFFRFFLRGSACYHCALLPPFFLGATIIGVALVSLLYFFWRGSIGGTPAFFLGATIIGVALVSFFFSLSAGECVFLQGV